MTTRIFESKEAFDAREDRTENGVSEGYARAFSGWAWERGNEGCWNCVDCDECKDCDNCADCVGCQDSVSCQKCKECAGCFDCGDCVRCVDCANCDKIIFTEDAWDVGRPDSPGSDGTARIPVIENIHGKILEAVSKPGALNMSSWHRCNSTHCRAGWVCVLAGRAGKRLEKKTSTLYAAMQIYKASSGIRVPPRQFYVSEERAMLDIRRCADEEAVGLIE